MAVHVYVFVCVSFIIILPLLFTVPGSIWTVMFWKSKRMLWQLF